MKPITIRMPDETIRFVRGMAARRGTDVSTVWRELAYKGMLTVENEQRPDEVLLNFLIQNLCLTRRLVGHVDDSLIHQADADARNAIEKMRNRIDVEGETERDAPNIDGANIQ